MIRIYRPLDAPKAELCHPVGEQGFLRLREKIASYAAGKETWTPPKMVVHSEDEGRILSHSDAPWFSDDLLIFREQAIAALGPVLVEQGELLPVACERGPLWIFRPMKVVDALDEDRSTILRFDSGAPMMVREYVFREEALGDCDIFRLTGWDSIFLSERFVKAWKKAKLVGLTFNQIWPTKPGKTKRLW